MRKILAGAAVVLLAVAIYFFVKSGKSNTPSPDPSQISAGAPTETAPATSPSTGTANNSSATPSTAGAAAVVNPLPNGGGNAASEPADAPGGIPPANVVANVRTAVRQYGDMFHGNPVGTNPEITSALNGHNPKGINFINQDGGMRINEQGELVDPWGTPVFFHQISGTEMEVRSAGPDKIMWTSDDVIAR